MTTLRGKNNNILEQYKIYDLNELIKFKYFPKSLINLKNLKYKLNYSTDPPNPTFDIKIIQERMLEYSQGLISEDFPFNNNFIIAGGFIVNLLIGIISDYTDIDIYIFNDFENQAKNIINYFKSKCQIYMTNNKSIINIYPVDYKINIQLIKIGGTPQKIISDFDLSYSQMMMINWDKIQMTSYAYKSLLTGVFTINRKAVIRNYRIVKAYIKGFILDNNEYQKSLVKKQNYNEHLLLNEVKTLIKALNKYHMNCGDGDDDMNELENLLMDYFPENSQDYKIMTKSIHLEQHMIENTTSEEFKKYLEDESNCTYLKLEHLDSLTFDNLKYYMEEDMTSSPSLAYPEMNLIEFKSIVYNPKYYLYPLQANIGEYYKFIKPLSKCYITTNVRFSDLKIFKGKKYLKAIFKPDSSTHSILKNLDTRIESLYQYFIKYNNFDINQCCFKKNAERNTIMVRIMKDSNLNFKKDDMVQVELSISNMFIGNPNMNTFGYHIDMKIRPMVYIPI